MSVDENHRVACFPHDTKCLLMKTTESHVFHTTQIVGSHKVACFPRCINHHDITQLSTSHTMFATSIFVITQLSNQEYWCKLSQTVNVRGQKYILYKCIQQCIQGFKNVSNSKPYGLLLDTFLNPWIHCWIHLYRIYFCPLTLTCA